MLPQFDGFEIALIGLRKWSSNSSHSYSTTIDIADNEARQVTRPNETPFTAEFCWLPTYVSRNALPQSIRISCTLRACTGHRSLPSSSQTHIPGHTAYVLRQHVEPGKEISLQDACSLQWR